MSSIDIQALLEADATESEAKGTTVIIVEPFNPQFSMFRDRKSDSFAHKGADIFSYIIQTFVFYVMSLVPLCDLIIDIGTIILYYNSTEYHTVHQAFSYICLVFIFLSTRSYLVSFIATSEIYASKLFPDSNLLNRMSYCVPFIGSFVAIHCSDNNQSTTTKITIYRVCRWFCVESFIMIGVVFTPFIMIYVMLRNYYFISLQLYIGLKSFKSNQLTQNRIHEIYLALKTEYEKNHQQNTLLKFCQVIFESMPQLIFQSYVFVTFQNVYEDWETELIYVSSVCIKFLAIFRLGYVLFENWDNLCDAIE